MCPLPPTVQTWSWNILLYKHLPSGDLAPDSGLRGTRWQQPYQGLFGFSFLYNTRKWRRVGHLHIQPRFQIFDPGVLHCSTEKLKRGWRVITSRFCMNNWNKTENHNIGKQIAYIYIYIYTVYIYKSVQNKRNERSWLNETATVGNWTSFLFFFHDYLSPSFILFSPVASSWSSSSSVSLVHVHNVRWNVKKRNKQTNKNINRCWRCYGDGGQIRGRVWEGFTAPIN